MEALYYSWALAAISIIFNRFLRFYTYFCPIALISFVKSIYRKFFADSILFYSCKGFQQHVKSIRPAIPLDSYTFFFFKHVNSWISRIKLEFPFLLILLLTASGGCTVVMPIVFSGLLGFRLVGCGAYLWQVAF